jgi:hypothetical protein
MGDDEYNIRKAKQAVEMRAKLGLDKNPLDGTSRQVNILIYISAEK